MSVIVSKELTCGCKKKFVSGDSALGYVRHRIKKTGYYIEAELRAYKCNYCGYVHLAKKRVARV